METILLIAVVIAAAVIAGLRLSKSGDTSMAKKKDTPQPAAAAPAAPSQPATPEPAPAHANGSTRRTVSGTGLLSGVSTWGYQLQKVNTKAVAASSFDLIVIDYSKDGSDAQAFTPGDVARMKAKPDGSRRQVVAYMSIGEAENYRYYWDASWATAKPTWLLDENPDWKENFSVCYWDPKWQQTFCGNPSAYLDKIIAAGFDGVYLDKCDVFEDLEARNKAIAAGRPDLQGDMIAFIARLSQYAKTRKPSFVVIMQNAEVLLEQEPLLDAIDGVAKESLLYGEPGPEKPNAPDEVSTARELLDIAKNVGRTVFVVEYLNDAAKCRQATATLDACGYISTISAKSRALDHLNPDPATV